MKADMKKADTQWELSLVKIAALARRSSTKQLCLTLKTLSVLYTVILQLPEAVRSKVQKADLQECRKAYSSYKNPKEKAAGFCAALGLANRAES